MTIDRFGLLRAASAYQAQGQATSIAPPARREAFADLLAQAVGGAADSGRKADAVRASVAGGQKPDYLEVVTAVAESEAALETLVAVRDRVVQAYEEIMRMPI
ncbi:MAG TPA: flagellar hook-basal body complex protein FliE [Beijerinckiaceae bacterium]|nr:flagellar hook-basal body complex protein FliE [Beijerinckiaceae bacterium]